jgi:hypothetical protein
VSLLLVGCGGSSHPATSSTTSSSSAATTSSSSAATAVGEGAAGSTLPVSASVGGVTATMHAGTHHPKVQQPWPIGFIVTRGGRPAGASVSYEYLFAGQVVARRSHYRFTWHFADVFQWPATAVGYPLTFRAVIVAGASTIDLDYPVQVVR